MLQASIHLTVYRLGAVFSILVICLSLPIFAQEPPSRDRWISPYNYLIVSHVNFAGGQIASLRDFLEANRAMNVQIHYVEDGDNVDTIKAAIRNFWLTGDMVPSYVLLLGAARSPSAVADAASDNYIPGYYHEAGWGHDALYDNYYVLFDTTGLEDLHGRRICPNMFLGRVPVTDQTEIATFLQKLEAYEAARDYDPVSNPDTGWHSDIALWAGDKDKSPDWPLPGQIRSQISSLAQWCAPPASNVTIFRYSDYTSDTAREAALCSDVNDGVSLVLGMATGANMFSFCEMWKRTASPYFDAATDLNNSGRLPFFVGASCNICQSDNASPTRSMTENLLVMSENGAVGIAGPTGSTSQLGNSYFAQQFFGVWRAHPDWSVGQIVATIKFSAAGDGTQANLLETYDHYAVHGDPSLVLYNSYLPRNDSTFSSGMEIDQPLPIQLTPYSAYTGFYWDTTKIVLVSDDPRAISGNRSFYATGTDVTPYNHRCLWYMFDVDVTISAESRYLTYLCRATDHPSGIAKVNITGVLDDGQLVTDVATIVDQYGVGMQSSARVDTVGEELRFYAFDLSALEGLTVDKLLIDYYGSCLSGDSTFRTYFDNVNLSSTWGNPPMPGELNMPSAVAIGGSATVTMSVEDPVDQLLRGDHLSYLWQAQYGSFTGSGPEVTYNAPSTTYSGVEIICTASDLGGHSVACTTAVDIVVPPQGCPVFYVDNGTGLVKDNVILTASEDAEFDGQPVVDYCPLAVEPSTERGIIALRITEEENEISYIDQVELIAVSYELGTDEQLAVLADGELVAVSYPIAPLKAQSSLTPELTRSIIDNDGDFFEYYGPGSILLIYPNVDSIWRLSRDINAKDKSSGGGLSDPPPGKNFFKLQSEDPIAGERTTGNTMSIHFLSDATGDTVVGKVYPRSNRAIPVVTDMTALLVNTTRPLVQVSWKKFIRSDQLALYKYRHLERTRESLPLLRASHPKYTFLTDRLDRNDGQEMILKSNDVVLLEFGLPKEKKGTIQYILKTVGYYVSADADGSLREAMPDFVRDVENYPNPFNAATRISFFLSQPTEVNIQVYNVLGQSVKTLYDGDLPGGPVGMTWDGRNTRGQSVSSGIYFYRILAGGETISRKMLMIK